MNNGDRPVRNPYVVLREEFDDWAVLFNPDTGRGYGLNPAGVYIWKLLDGKHTIDTLLEEIRHLTEGVPDEVSDHIGVFLDALVGAGLAGVDSTSFGPLNTVDRVKGSSSPFRAVREAHPFTYEPPRLVDLNSEQAIYGKACTSNGTQATGSCGPGGVPCSGAPCCSGACDITCGCGGCANVSNCVTGAYDTTCKCQYGSYAAPQNCISNGIYATGCFYGGHP